MKKAYLLHISHYDPAWINRKETEEPFDVEVGKKILKKLKRYCFDTVIVDCADGIEYESHPELKRDYTVSKELVSEFVREAKSLDIDIVPKLNFAKSGRNRHDMWMAPHVDLIDWTGAIDLGIYWKVAEDLINELTDFFRPKSLFHIGMDEDHYRSVNQYAETIIKLDSVIKKHGLRTMIWNDSCYCASDSPNKHHADKCEDAEKLLPKDIVHVLWEYNNACHAPAARLKNEGFDVWAAPGKEPKKVKAWQKCLSDEKGDGLLMTNWFKCSKSNEIDLLKCLDALGASYN